MALHNQKTFQCSTTLKWQNKLELTPLPPGLNLSNNLLRLVNWQWNVNGYVGAADLHKSP